jgi:uncharacterized SAM-binding protein YcdF (DUF218 family)
MFFVLSKTLGLFTVPSNLMMALGLIGILLLFTRFRRLASWLIVTSLVLIVFAGYSPLGKILMLPLEQRFPPWDESRGPPDGIVVLGGVINPVISLARGVVALSRSAERITVTAELARRYPNARVVFAGGASSLDPKFPPEAPVAVKELIALGVAHDRITVDEQSRNTIENAVFSRLLANPKLGERWILVTSAAHMPRAIGVFRAAGFPIEAYPVNYQTIGDLRDDATDFQDLPGGLGMTDQAIHEWAGLVIYRLAGKTSELLPAP